MAPRSASRCCSAFRSSLTGPLTPASPSSSTTVIPDGVWITDSDLACAFARYCRTINLPASSGTARRFASNVPGPLESRRRLGKRQMTDQLSPQLSLNPAGSMLPPAWALPNAPDLRQWQWTPPRDASEWAQGLSLLSRQAGTAAKSGTSLFPSFGMPKWLTDLGSDLAESTDAAAAEQQQKPARAVMAQQLYTKLDAWRETAATLSETDFATQLDDVCSEFQTQLRLAALTVDEARDVFRQIWAVLRKTGSSMEANAPLLFAAVLEGIRTCPLLQAQDLGPAFWRELFVCVAELLPGSTKAESQNSLTASVALDTLLATPPPFITSIADLLPPHLCAIFVGHAMAKHTDTSMNTAAVATAAAAKENTYIHTLAEKIARALEQVDLEQHGRFLDATTQLLITSIALHSPPPSLTNSKDVTNAGISMPNLTVDNIVSAWLLTLAQMPQVRQDFLYKTMSQLQQAAVAAPPLSETDAATTTTTAAAAAAAATTATNSNVAWHMHRTDLCELLLAQWMSRGYVTQQAQLSFRRTMAILSASAHECDHLGHRDHRDHPAALGALALAVFWPKHSRSYCVALYMSLLRGLQTPGRDAAAAADELLLSVTSLLEQLQAATPTPASPSPSAPARLKLPPATFFESLAWAMDDVHAALRLHRLYVATKTGVQAESDYLSDRVQLSQLPLWSVGFWDRYADQLAAALDSGALTPTQVGYALDLSHRATQASQSIKAARNTTAQPSQTKTRTPYKPAKRLGASTVALVEKLAVYFALDPDLAPRRALRGVEHCRQLLAVHGGRSLSTSKDGARLASSTVLRALFHLITRDLEDALPGRTTRLRWFLSIVEREYSSAEALISGRALDRWRAAAKQIRREETRRLLQEARGLLDRKEAS
ncbi:MAG: hypothetical protein STHCBS139747_001730 [Sporothrix thermara]